MFQIHAIEKALKGFVTSYIKSIKGSCDWDSVVFLASLSVLPKNTEI